MEEPTQVELLIRALRGVIRKFSSDNPTDYSPSNRDKSHDTCYICKEKGHWATECPDRNKKRAKRDKSQDTCYYCQEKGHWSPNCPKKQQKQEEENSEQEEEEEVPSLQEEVRHVHKDKKRRRNDSKEEDEKPVRVKKLKQEKE